MVGWVSFGKTSCPKVLRSPVSAKTPEADRPDFCSVGFTAAFVEIGFATACGVVVVVVATFCDGSRAVPGAVPVKIVPNNIMSAIVFPMAVRTIFMISMCGRRESNPR